MRCVRNKTIQPYSTFLGASQATLDASMIFVR